MRIITKRICSFAGWTAILGIWIGGFFAWKAVTRWFLNDDLEAIRAEMLDNRIRLIGIGDEIRRLSESINGLMSAEPHILIGLASWYGGAGGGTTASGEPFDPDIMAAAHRSLPFGTELEVENYDTGLHARVVVNDRGPYAESLVRILDVTPAAAKALGMERRGVAPVKIRIVRIPILGLPSVRPSEGD